MIFTGVVVISFSFFFSSYSSYESMSVGRGRACEQMCSVQDDATIRTFLRILRMRTDVSLA